MRHELPHLVQQLKPYDDSNINYQKQLQQP